MTTAPNDDDWKGEHLIRQMPPVIRRGYTIRRHGVEIDLKPPHGVCKVEGCRSQLDSRNVTGVCQKHRHKGRRYVKGGAQ